MAALGQYFTADDGLCEWVFSHTKFRGAELLEPSVGEGHLLRKFFEHDPSYPVVAMEIDETLIVPFPVIRGDFLVYDWRGKKFRTIVANPPYVAVQGGRNLYIDFIETCFDLLTGDGELVFIVPSDVFKQTSAAGLLARMHAAGSWTDVWFPNDEKLFVGASVDVVLFRYEKGNMTHETMLARREEQPTLQTANCGAGIVTWGPGGASPLSDKFDVRVGLASGKDKVFFVPFGNMELLTDKGKTERVIFAKTFPTGVTEIDAHLLGEKGSLMARKIKKFSEANWFEWGAPRNIQYMESQQGWDCIYVRNMTRKAEVAFRGKVGYFGGTLLCVIPKKKMGTDELDAVVAQLNHPDTRVNYEYAGRFKIGQKLLANLRY